MAALLREVEGRWLCDNILACWNVDLHCGFTLSGQSIRVVRPARLAETPKITKSTL